MKKANWVGLVSAGLLAGLLWGCATAADKDVATHRDVMTGQRTDVMNDNLLEPDKKARELLWLQASRVFHDHKDYDFYLEVHYEALEELGWLDIRPGETLTIEADDQTLTFDGSGSVNTRTKAQGVVSETALYLASANDLRTIAHADEVTVTVQGRNGSVVRQFVPENFEKFEKFVASYVDGVIYDPAVHRRMEGSGPGSAMPPRDTP